MNKKKLKMTAKMNADTNGLKPDTVDKVRAGKRHNPKVQATDELYAMVMPKVLEAIKEAVNKM